MKQLSLIFILVFITLAAVAQPGKYAGKHKGLIQTVYTDSRKIKALSGWEPIQGSVLTPLSDSLMTMVEVYKKGTTFIVFFSTQKDIVANTFIINDVLEVMPVTKGWIIKTSFCQLNKVENPYIVAWARETSSEYLKVLKKAWQFNRATKQIEPVPVKGIACLHEGFDLTQITPHEK